MRIPAIATLISAALTLPAAAGDWTGPYVGVAAGYGALMQEDSTKGFQGSLFAGFNMFAEPILLGVEADVSPFAMTSSGTFVGGYGYTINTAYLASFRGRIGVPLGNALLYASAGVALRENDFQVSGSIQHTLELKPTYGAGVDYAVSDAVFVRADAAIFSSSQGYDFAIVKAGIGYRF